MNSDRKLQEKVLDELQWEPSIDESDIAVSAKDGIVTLSGQVRSYRCQRPFLPLPFPFPSFRSSVRSVFFSP
jgi:hypothetical protein